jgi:hypothetical protein
MASHVKCNTLDDFTFTSSLVPLAMDTTNSKKNNKKIEINARTVPNKDANMAFPNDIGIAFYKIGFKCRMNSKPICMSYTSG